MKIKVMILVGFVTIFVAGGMVVYFALSPSQQIKGKISRQIAKISSKESYLPPIPTLPSVETASFKPNEAHEIIDLLRTNFLDAPTLVGQEITPKNLGSILEKLGSKAKISPYPVASISSPQSIKSELIYENIAYWRVPSFSEKSITTLTETWTQWQKHKLIGLIIDLRDFESANDYAGAADFASLFINPNTPLFTMQGIQSPQKVFQSARQPLSLPKNFPIFVLINENTRGAGEIFAYLLRQHTQAILLGQPTSGESAAYTENKLRSGRFFRRATAAILAASGENFIGKPIVPDIQIDVHFKEQREILQQIPKQSISEFIKELPPRKRFNEASLVKEEDVELDEIIQEKTQTKKNNAPLPKDIVLQRAIDALRGISLALNP